MSESAYSEYEIQFYKYPSIYGPILECLCVLSIFTIHTVNKILVICIHIQQNFPKNENL